MKTPKETQTPTKPGGVGVIQENYIQALKVAKAMFSGKIELDDERAYTLGGAIYAYLEVFAALNMKDWSLREAKKIDLPIEDLIK